MANSVWLCACEQPAAVSGASAISWPVVPLEGSSVCCLCLLLGPGWPLPSSLFPQAPWRHHTSRATSAKDLRAPRGREPASKPHPRGCSWSWPGLGGRGSLRTRSRSWSDTESPFTRSSGRSLVPVMSGGWRPGFLPSLLPPVTSVSIKCVLCKAGCCP